ncbi:hypothetical protein Csa_019655 [Cucumis sativus]|nr:hypothetical protein Csa_019655 [Cucumis sativus]
MAVEKVNQSTIPATAIMKIKLRDVIRNTNFEGICGDFDLVDGELKNDQLLKCSMCWLRRRL